MSDYENEWRPDGMRAEAGEECLACGGPCGGNGGSLCDPRCTSCNPGADGRSS